MVTNKMLSIEDQLDQHHPCSRVLLHSSVFLKTSEKNVLLGKPSMGRCVRLRPNPEQGANKYRSAST